MSTLEEFRPSLLFLGKFLAVYFVGNLLYGLYITTFQPVPDPVTRIVTHQSAQLLNVAGYAVTIRDHATEPKIAMKEKNEVVLYVFEGCNGINVMVVFVGFLFAFGGRRRLLLIFTLAGVAFIHLFNLFRVSLLYHLALNNSLHFYYYHKYFFTATLYFIVFLLWVVWVMKFNAKREISAV